MTVLHWFPAILYYISGRKVDLAQKKSSDSLWTNNRCQEQETGLKHMRTYHVPTEDYLCINFLFQLPHSPMYELHKICYLQYMFHFHITLSKVNKVHSNLQFIHGLLQLHGKAVQSLHISLHCVHPNFFHYEVITAPHVLQLPMMNLKPDSDKTHTL